MQPDILHGRAVQNDGGERGFLAGGGEMGARMRNFDWTKTPLGAPEQWPQSLKTIVRVMLDSRYAMWMLWGPELTFFCNDAYLPTVGLKRDWVLGARSDKVWEEIWPDIGPRITRVLQQGESTWDEALLLFLERKGFPEETYHTFSYSPVYDDNSRIAGMLCVVTEVTDRVIGEHQLHLLRDLAAHSSGVQNVQECCKRCCAVLCHHPTVIPLVGLYLLDTAGETLELAAYCVPNGHRPLPDQLGVNDDASPWPTLSVMNGQSSDIDDLAQLGLSLSAHPWPDKIKHAVLLPLKGSGQDRPIGMLLLGASPRRAFSSEYRGFLELVSAQIASVIADAQAYETERQRLEALAELDRAKTTFFSNVSHEFRTPLTLMLGPLEESVAAHDIPAQRREQLELAHRNSLRLLRLVNSLLDFSRIEAGRIKAHYEPVNLMDFTRDLASSFRSAIERAGLQFHVLCEDLHEAVYVDRDMWEKIVLNLLSNAFKFTLHGSIEVHLRRDGTSALLEVRDTGVGIPDEELPRLFERFHRVENAQGRTQEGTGIGLALVHELVKLHHGSISAQSTAGHGTTFRIHIPFGTQHLPTDRISARPLQPLSTRSTQTFVEEALRWLPGARNKTSAMQVSRPPDEDRRFASTFGSRIIIADDNADMRDYLYELLAPRYEIEIAMDGQHALELASRQAPALIVSDVMMPRLDGFALIKAVRNNEKLRDIPVILLSARAGEESRIEGLDAGADDYLVKPFSSRELLARVGALLELTRMRAENEQRLSLALSSIQDQFFMVDAESRYTLVNQRVIEMVGRPREELIGRSLFDVFPDIRGGGFETELRVAKELHQSRKLDVFYQPWNKWFEISIYPAGDGAAVLVADITQRKNTQESIRLRTEQFETLLEQAPIGMYLIDGGFRIRQVNPIAEAVFGDIDNLIDRDFDEVMHILWPEDYANEIVQRFRHTLNTGEPYSTPEHAEQRLDRGVVEYYQWQIHRIPLPDATLGVVCYFRDISFEVKARMALIDNQRELEEADRQKDEFLAMLAHELRNPLAPITNAGELLARVATNDAKTAPIIDILRRQTIQLTRLVDDLLDVSRITRGRIDLQIDTVDLSRVISQAIETVEPLLRESHHHLSIVSSYATLRVRGDFARLVQCVVNILTNAIKYTHAGGNIQLSSWAEDGRGVIEIRDDGAGLSHELLPKVFDLFVQGERTLDRAQGGLGIGLSVVKGLVHMHGGEVTAASNGQGQGSTFTIRLPLVDTMTEGKPAAEFAGVKPMSVLIVDDNIDHVNSLASLLSLDGHTIEVAYSANQALERLRSFKPEVAMLDIGLPEIDGYELADRIQADSELSNISLIAITGYGQEEDRRRTASHGFHDHLVKPVDFERLRLALQGVGLTDQSRK